MKPRRDIDDDDMIDRVVAREDAERRAFARDRARSVAAAATAQAEVEREELAMRAAGTARENTRRFVMQEYVNAGVEPLEVDAEGCPTVSLSLLLTMGWTIEDFGREGKKLVHMGG